MKDLFEGFDSREDLLRAVEERIAQTTDGNGKAEFRLPNPEADALRAKYEAASKNSANEALKRKSAEERLQQLAQERAEESAELERLRRAQAADPNELRATLQRYVEQTSANRAKLAALEAQIQPLREENAAYKARETKSKIETQLVDAARKLDCCETALRDVKRLAPLFHLTDDGVAATEDARSVDDVLQDEIALSPHWLNRSQGSAAASGRLDAQQDAERERFAQALKRGDFAEALRNAPRERVDRR